MQKSNQIVVKSEKKMSRIVNANLVHKKSDIKGLIAKKFLYIEWFLSWIQKNSLFVEELNANAKKNWFLKKIFNIVTVFEKQILILRKKLKLEKTSEGG